MASVRVPSKEGLFSFDQPARKSVSQSGQVRSDQSVSTLVGQGTHHQPWTTTPRSQPSEGP